MEHNYLYKELSHKLVGMAYSIHNILGPGLLESAYEGAMVIELEIAGIAFERQKVFPVYYKGRLAGAYAADLVVENSIILELKVVKQLTDIHRAQLLNYLHISKLKVGYLFNFFGLRVRFSRLIL